MKVKDNRSKLNESLIGRVDSILGSKGYKTINKGSYVDVKTKSSAVSRVSPHQDANGNVWVDITTNNSANDAERIENAIVKQKPIIIDRIVRTTGVKAKDGGDFGSRENSKRQHLSYFRIALPNDIDEHSLADVTQTVVDMVNGMYR